MTWAEQAVLWIHCCNQTGPNSLLYFRNIQIYASAVWQTSFSLTFYLFSIVFTLLFWRLFFFFLHQLFIRLFINFFARVLPRRLGNDLEFNWLKRSGDDSHVLRWFLKAIRVANSVIRTNIGFRGLQLSSPGFSSKLQTWLSVINMLKNIGCKNHIMGPHLNTLQVTESLK